MPSVQVQPNIDPHLPQPHTQFRTSTLPQTPRRALRDRSRERSRDRSRDRARERSRDRGAHDHSPFSSGAFSASTATPYTSSSSSTSTTTAPTTTATATTATNRRNITPPPTPPSVLPAADVRALRDAGYRVRRTIRSGPYGCVVRAETRVGSIATPRLSAGPVPHPHRPPTTSATVAIKVIYLSRLTEYERRILTREVDFLRAARHKHVVTLHRVVTRVHGEARDAFGEEYRGADAVYLVLEYLRGLDLLEHIRNNGLPREDVVIELARQMAAAVLYTHKQGWSHRDIKLENFVLDAPLGTTGHAVGGGFNQSLPVCRAMLVDFGYAVRNGEGGKRGQVGTPPYMSPEAFGKDRDYSLTASDVWALGVCICVLLCGRYPFHGPDEDTLRKFVLYTRPKFESPAWEQVSRPMRHLVRDMLRKNSDERPSAEEVLRRIMDLQFARETERLEMARKKAEAAAIRHSFAGRTSGALNAKPSPKASRSASSRSISRMSGSVRPRVHFFRRSRDLQSR